MRVRATSFSGIVFGSLFFFSISCCWLFFSSLVLSPISKAQIAPPSATYTVHGIVVNSLTGEPVPRALVQIPGEQQRSVLTGVDGKFEFADVPVGPINVTYRKPGFFAAQAIQSPRAQAAWITVGPNQPPTVLKLIPEGVISGHVLGDGGEPAEQLPVQVFGSQVENGKRVWGALKTVRADDLGEFRFADLAPGKYYVFVGPSGWPASFEPRRQPRRSGRAIAAAGQASQAARGYPGMFYPAAADMASAAPIEVRAGQHVEINMNVASQLFHYISGTVSGYPADGPGMNLVAMNAAGQPIQAGFRFDPTTGRFRTLWLPPGSYRLRAEMQDLHGVQNYFANQEVNLTGDITGAQLNLTPCTTIPVSFQVEKSRDSSPDFTRASETRMGRHGMVQLSGDVPAQVMLTPQDTAFSQRQISSRLSETDSTLELADVSPGIYKVQIFPTGGRWYVESARSGSIDLLEQDLTVEGGASVKAIEITLRDDAAMLKGNVKFTGDPEAALLIVVPEGRWREARSVEVTKAIPGAGPTEGATFNLWQLAPGRYKVFAVDQMDFEYQNPLVLEKYAAAAREIALEANVEAKLDLEVFHVQE
jgi:carboxypeptidase family protein